DTAASLRRGGALERHGNLPSACISFADRCHCLAGFAGVHDERSWRDRCWSVGRAGVQVLPKRGVRAVVRRADREWVDGTDEVGVAPEDQQVALARMTAIVLS